MSPPPSRRLTRSVVLSPRLRWAVVFLVAAAVFVASVVAPPGDGGPTLGPFGLVGADKWLHAVAYAAVAGALAHALDPKLERAALGGFFGAFAYGFVVELAQWVAPTRQFDLFDAAANGVGAALGVGLWLVALAAVRRLG
ncbi:VanZ family protein [Haloprofundus halobius]|uniref:VanZ family protein n=1 Tax=Haloprofundus halobius TaxID=2876194 RepID=UPI001CCAE458|nr:VanZ family protein [Haloprofundus halobius]